jgi:hypothetical protein
MLGSLGSQGISFLAIASTIILGLKASDAYSLGLQIGNTALVSIVLSIVYEVVIGRPHFKAWGLASLATIPVSLILGVVVWKASLGHALGTSGETYKESGIYALFALGGGALAVAGVQGVRMACHGRPVPLTLVTAVPNTSLLLGTLATAAMQRFAGIEAVDAPGACWALGAVVTATVYWRMAGKQLSETTEPAKEGLLNKVAHIFALAWSAGNASIAGILLLSATTRLGPGTTTLLYLVSRIGTSIFTTGVNAILLVRYSWRTNASVSEVWIKRSVSSVFIFLLIATTIAGIYGGGSFAFFAAACLWLYSGIVTGFVSREANVSRLVGRLATKAGAESLLGGAAVLVYYLHPTPSGFFGALTIVNVTDLSVLTWQKQPRLRGIVAFSLPAMAIGFFVLTVRHHL